MKHGQKITCFWKIFIGLNLLHCVMTSPDARRLLKDLFDDDYSSIVMPKQRHSDVMNVTVRFIPRGITEFNEVAGQISIAMGVDIRWNDEYLLWSPPKYGNLTHLLIPEEQIWTPKLSIANPSDRVPIFPEDQFSVRLFSTGQAMLLKGGTVRCTCKPNLRYYPFDEHVCFVKLITLDHVFTEISFLPELKLDVYENVGEWDLFDSEIESSRFDLFSCAVFKFKIKRRPEFSILTICIPILCLGLLNACVFLIPPECGERISFAITALLSFAVFMTIVSAVMPRNTDPVPILCYVLMLMLLESGLIVAVSITGLRLYYRPDSQKIPDCVQRVVSALTTLDSHPQPLVHNSESPDNHSVFPEQDQHLLRSVKWSHVGRVFDYFCFTVSFCSFTLYVLIYAIIVMAS